MPIEIQLREKHSAIAISAARRHSRLVVYRNGNSPVGFRRSFFRPIDESVDKIAASWYGNDRFQLDSSNGENRTVIARDSGLSLFLIIAIAVALCDLSFLNTCRTFMSSTAATINYGIPPNFATFLRHVRIYIENGILNLILNIKSITRE